MASFYYTEEELANIKKYKAGITIDKSLIYKYIVSPLCARLVLLTPSWLAPNVLTLFGLVCNIVAFFLASHFLADNPNPPSWVPMACAILILLYMLSDNMDGKQAVRTGSSTPLGELLDHGCDSMIIGMGTLTTAYILGATLDGPLRWAGFGMFAFYLAHWQEYFNHFLELGYFNGPTEAETFAILLYAATTFTGRAFWTEKFLLMGYSISMLDIVSTVLVGVTIFTIFTTIYKGSQLAVSNNVSLSKAYSQLIPLITTWLAGFVWVTYSPSIYLLHPGIFLNSMNLIFSYLTVNCILQRMCNLSYQFFYFPSTPMFFAAANSVFGYYNKGQPLVNEELVLYGAFIFWLVTFLHFSVTLTQGLCKQLGVKALTIPYPNKATKKTN